LDGYGSAYICQENEMTLNRVITLTSGLLGALIFCSGYSYAASHDEYQNVFIEYLELGPATYLNITAHGKDAATIDSDLSKLYHGNKLQPFWIRDGKPSQRAVEILAALDDAESHGLVPASYFVDKIHEFWDSTDTAGLVKLDLGLTMGMVRYVADQQEGRMEPREIDPKLFAGARDSEVDWGALGITAFAATDMKAYLANQAPSYFQYRELRKTLAEYRALAAKGGWPSVPSGDVLKPGMQDPRVLSVRKRLAVTDPLASGDSDNAVFDPALEDAVKRFQAQHNLSADGVIGKQSMAAMNESIESRIEQIIINMERYRWLNLDEDENLVAVNIAGFRAAAGKPSHFDLTMPVIVGKTYHQTPVFSDEITYVVFNPYWNLTSGIARNETLPRLRKDSHYLEKHNMKIFESWDPGAKELDATTMDWSKVTPRDMNQYHVRQEPGPTNALGTLKLVFPNQHSVYLHDTPSHGLFSQEKRDFSHGCIRMDRPADMAAWVLGGEENGWTVERVNEIVASRKRQVVVLDQPMPVYLLYRTAYIDPEDKSLYFYEDVYGRDKLLANALAGSGQ
jgi:murein L,D-transpeptidase YcbB/YkuD